MCGNKERLKKSFLINAKVKNDDDDGTHIEKFRLCRKCADIFDEMINDR